MLRANFETPKLRWTKATDIERTDTASIRGHIFVLTEDGLCAYKLQEGPLSDLSVVGHGFLTGFVNYIVHNNLTKLIGLQILGCCDGSMSELVLDYAGFACRQKYFTCSDHRLVARVGEGHPARLWRTNFRNFSLAESNIRSISPIMPDARFLLQD